VEAFKSKVYWLLGVILGLAFLYMAREALVILFTAFIFSSAVLPLVEKLERYMPRWLAVLIPFSALLLIGIGLVLPVASLALQQLQLFLSDIPGYLDRLKTWLGQWDFISRRYSFLSGVTSDALIQQLSQNNSLFFSGFTGMTLVISQVGLDLLSALVISIFMLLDEARIKQYFLRFWPAREHTRLNNLLDNLIRSTGAFVSGQLLFMAFVGGTIAIGLYGLHLPFSILLGAITGALTIIPIIGPNIALIPALGIALLTGGWTLAVWVFLLYVVVQVLANNIIGPLIMGRAVGLHPLAILIAILCGGIMFGMIGIVLAIPVVACLNIILAEWFLDPEHRFERFRRLQDSEASPGT
jgi:predicted PurR-regulated permease PerM